VALGESEVWLLWGFADLAQPVCRVKDEPRPTCAIVHYAAEWQAGTELPDKLMRSSHATWTSTLDPVQEGNGEGNSEKSAFCRVIDPSRTSALGGRYCAERVAPPNTCPFSRFPPLERVAVRVGMFVTTGVWKPSHNRTHAVRQEAVYLL
jgi:hypothetical protein